MFPLRKGKRQQPLQRQKRPTFVHLAKSPSRRISLIVLTVEPRFRKFALPAASLPKLRGKSVLTVEPRSKKINSLKKTVIPDFYSVEKYPEEFIIAFLF
jgi:hypothetical protein